MGELLDLDTQRPHVVILEQCPKCSARYVAVVPTAADFSRLECAKCGHIGTLWTYPDDEPAG